jgi:hypothetical protein
VACVALCVRQGELLRQLPTEDQDTRNVPAVFIAVKVRRFPLEAHGRHLVQTDRLLLLWDRSKQKRHRRRCDRLKARLGALLRQALTFEATALSYSPLLTGTSHHRRRHHTLPLEQC